MTYWFGGGKRVVGGGEKGGGTVGVGVGIMVKGKEERTSRKTVRF